MTDELLARRILALEERIERVETSGPSTQRVILDALVDLRRDSADRFDRMDQRLDRMDQRFDQMDQRFDRMEQRMEQRFGAIEGLLGRVLVLVGGRPGGTEPPKQ